MARRYQPTNPDRGITRGHIAAAPVDDELPPSDEGSFDGDFDSEHLETMKADTYQGVVNSITEGTISMPHSTDRDIARSLVDEHEINKQIDAIQSKTKPAEGVDVIHARRMLVRRFFLPVGQSFRICNTNHARQYLIIMCDLVDNAAANIAISTTPINGVLTPLGGATFVVSAVAASGPTSYGPFWHQGELHAQPLTVAAALSVLEFFGA